MEKNWAEKLLSASKRANEKQQKEFLCLVDQANNLCTLDVARILMKTFSSSPDYGTQERVESILATADPEIVTQAILEELPRLWKEAPEWAESLIGLEVEKRQELLQRVASTMPEHVKNALRQLINDSNFKEFYPNAMNIVV